MSENMNPNYNENEDIEIIIYDDEDEVVAEHVEEVHQEVQQEEEQTVRQELPQEEHQEATAPNTTYSWVNPRLQQSSTQGIGQGSQAKPQEDEIVKHAYYHVNPVTTEAAAGAQGTYQNSQQQNYHVNTSQPQKQAKKNSTGKKWGATIAMAVVFGLIAGSVTYGVNYFGNKLNGDGTNGGKVTSAPVIQSTAVADGTTTSKVEGTFTVAEVAKNAMPSMVAISTETVEEIQSFFGTYSQTVPASGSGVIVGQNETELLIATNNHVVAGAKRLSVAFIDDVAVEAQIKGTDQENDLAVVAVKLEDIPEETMAQIKIATLGDSDAMEIGEEVVAIGNALGYGQSVTNGIISAVDRTVTSQDESTGATTESTGLIQTNAAINPGNSGGALLNMKGELIGINEAKYSSTSVEGMGFAIPLAKAEPILENLMSMETRSKVDEEDASYIGIAGKNVSADVNTAYGIPVGVYVESVETDGPAEKAGIKARDIITELDGRKITTMDELQDALEYYKKGEVVEVKIQRMADGEYKERTCTVTLGDKSQMEITDSYNQNGFIFGD